MSSFSSHEIVVVVSIVAFEIATIGYVSLAEICDFATNEFATSCDYLTFTTIVGYIYNYCLHLKPLATTLRLTYD